MNAKLLLETAIEMIRQGQVRTGEDEIYLRMTRLVGQSLFALGRKSDSGVFGQAGLQKAWLSATGDIFGDNLSQIILREKVIELKYTEPKIFNTIFTGEASLPLYRQARRYFGETRKNKNLSEAETVVLTSLALAFLLLAEDRYERGRRLTIKHSMQEQIERKSAQSEILRNQESAKYVVDLKRRFRSISRELRSLHNYPATTVGYEKAVDSSDQRRF